MQKLEALLERVRRNKTQAPVRAVATPVGAPLALDALPASPAPPAVAQAPARLPLTPAPAPVTPPAPPAHLEAPAPAVTKTEPPPPPVTTPSWRPEPGSAVQPRPSTMPPMEISDDDLLEVTTLPPEAEVPAEGELRSRGVQEDDDIDVDVEEEKAPVSSSRFKVPGSLDEALASAAQLEGEREIPIHTPPPESGPQEALPATGLEAPRLPDVEQLEADLMPPPSMGPTAEQLGETIELEAPRGPALEIDVGASHSEPPVEAPPEELEVTLPRASMPSGLYDVNITAPPMEQAPPPEVREAVTVPSQALGDGPERTARPPLGATDVPQVTLTTPLPPKSFVELLDASLGV